MVAYMHLYHHNKYLCIVVTPSFVELQPKTLQYLFFFDILRSNIDFTRKKMRVK